MLRNMCVCMSILYVYANANNNGRINVEQRTFGFIINYIKERRFLF